MADFDTGNIRVNQVGYLPGAGKVATINSGATSALSWELRDTSGNAVASGQTTIYGSDQASGDHLHHADFSSVTAEGTYRLWVQNEGESVSFRIGSNLYPDLPNEAMEYFYFHRMGTPVDGQYLTDSAHAHAALHPGDEQTGCYEDWCGGDILDVRYSWADAGDYGIYAVNHAISAWTLLNLLERYPGVFADGSLDIPESGNARPDILDEVDYGSIFMAGMLPSSGLASHKVHNDNWSAFPINSIDEENSEPRQAQRPSTNATYAVARNMAHLARLVAPYDSTRANTLWSVAEDAWNRAETHDVVYYTGSTSDTTGGGDYPDTNHSDDRYAAAVEMYLTAYTRGDGNLSTYRGTVTGSPHYKEVSQFDWKDVQATGTLSLLTADHDLSGQDVSDMKNNLLAHVDRLLNTMNGEGYPVPLPGSQAYPWGSNSFIVNKMILMGYAYDVSGDLKYLRSMHSSMDYLVGNNPMKISYITGYGEYYETDTHDRWAWKIYLNGTQYPRGWLSGGPNNELINDNATPTDQPAAKSYAGKDTAPDAWASKENTINWNAPLVWVAQYLNDTETDLGADSNPGPTATPTPTPTSGSDPTPTPTPTPTPQSSSGDLILQYRNGDDLPGNEHVKPHFNIKNNGSSSVALSDLTIRYWYTIDSSSDQAFHCDFAQVGCADINGAFFTMAGPKAEADTYLEVTFSGTGSIVAGGDSGELQVRFNKTDWSAYDETNDYSYDGTKTAFADWDRVTLYQNGELVWGIEP